MKDKIKKIVLLLAGIFVIVFLITCIPRKIDIDYPAIQYRYNDPEYIVQTSISMKGKLFKPLFFEAKYTGTCVIEGYDFTEDNNPFDMRFGRSVNGFSVLTYTITLPNGKPDLEIIGRIGMSGNFDSVYIEGIALEDIDSTGFREFISISAPAETREEALRIGEKWSERYF